MLIFIKKNMGFPQHIYAKDKEKPQAYVCAVSDSKADKTREGGKVDKEKFQISRFYDILVQKRVVPFYLIN